MNFKILFLSMLAISFYSTSLHAEENCSNEKFCLEFSWGLGYGYVENLFCGVLGEKIISSKDASAIKDKIAALQLASFALVKLPGYLPFTIYNQTSSTKNPARTIIVFTKDRLTKGFFKKKIGYSHQILSSDGFVSQIEDDLEKRILSSTIHLEQLIHIVNAKMQDTDINAFVKFDSQ